MNKESWKWFFYLNPAFWAVIGIMFIGFILWKEWKEFVKYIEEAVKE